MHIRKSLIALLIVWVLSIAPVFAIESGDLYFLAEGDLYFWNNTIGTPRQLTEWGYNGSPVLSPDGSRIAYVSVAEEAVNRGSDPQSEDSYLIYSGTPANNIWVMDTATQDFERIADQSPNFPVRRGTPVWSPTGDELAWVEYGASGENFNVRAKLIIYNFVTQSTRETGIVNLGFQDAGLRLPFIQWGPGGISYQIFTFVESGDAQIQLYLIDPVNNNVSQFILYSSASPYAQGDITPDDYVWVEHNARAMIAILNSNNSWTLLDPTNGNQVQLTNPPSLIARNGNGASLTPDYNSADGGREIRWIATAANGNQVQLPRITHRLRDQPVLSPDGNLVAFHVNEGITAGSSMRYMRIDTSQNEQLILSTPGDSGFYSNNEPPYAGWTPMRWVTNGNTGNPVPTPPNPNPGTGTIACDIPVPFTIGDFVTVQAGIPNNLRANPTTGAAFIASLFPGDLVSVADGPVCADGFRWWEIAGEGGFSGWTVEAASDASEAWLLHLPQSPLLNDCPLQPRMSPGMTGFVLPGIPNVLRDGPDVTGTNVIGQIPANGQFTVMGNSLCGIDGRRWYPVEYNGDFGLDCRR